MSLPAPPEPRQGDRWETKPGDIARAPLARLIDVIANAAAAGWGQTARIALLLVVGAAAVALVVMAVGTGHL